MLERESIVHDLKDEKKEDEEEISLRPLKLSDYLGQTEAKKTLSILSKRLWREVNPWIMFCYMDLRG